MSLYSHYIKSGYWMQTTRAPKGWLRIEDLLSTTENVLSYPVEHVYIDNTELLSNQGEQTVQYFQYVTATDKYYEYLGTTNGALTDYRELTPEEVLIINGRLKAPVDNVYVDLATMYQANNQRKQIDGFIYRVGSDYYEYLGTRNGDSSDYIQINSGGGGSVSFGSTGQIPFSNGTSDDFLYNTGFIFTNNKSLRVGLDGSLTGGEIIVYGGGGAGTSSIKLYNSSASQGNTVSWNLGTGNGDFLISDASFNRMIEISDNTFAVRLPQQSNTKIDSGDDFTAVTKGWVNTNFLSTTPNLQAVTTVGNTTNLNMISTNKDGVLVSDTGSEGAGSAYVKLGYEATATSSGVIVVKNSNDIVNTLAIPTGSVNSLDLLFPYNTVNAPSQTLGIGATNGTSTVYTDTEGVINVSSFTTLQAVLDTGNTAVSLDTNHFFGVDLTNGNSGYFDAYFDNTTQFTDIFSTPLQIYIASYNSTRGGEFIIDQGNLYFTQTDATGNFDTTIDFQEPTAANSVLLFPATTTGTKTLAVSVNNVATDSAGNVSIPFTSLNDTPSTYTSQAGKLVAVNTGETALEFIDAPTELLTHYQELSVDVDAVAATDFTISPTNTNGVKIISIDVSGWVNGSLTTGDVRNLNEVDGIRYEYLAASGFWLDVSGGNNFTVEVTNATNDLDSTRDTVFLRILYEDIAAPGGK